MFDIGCWVFWVEAKSVDGGATVYVQSGMVISVPNDPYNAIACVVSRDDGGGLKPLRWVDDGPTRVDEQARAAALGYAYQLSAQTPEKPVSVRIICPAHGKTGGHKCCTVVCTKSDRKQVYKETDKTGKGRDITETYSVLVHPINYGENDEPCG